MNKNVYIYQNTIRFLNPHYSFREFHRGTTHIFLHVFQGMIIFD